MSKKKKQDHKLRKVCTRRGFSATNSIDPASPIAGIVGKGNPVPNYEIPEGIYKRELAEYLDRKQTA